MRDRRTSSAGHGGTRSLPDDKMEYRDTTGRTYKHGQDSTGGETTPRQIYQRVRDLPNEALCEPTTAVLQLPEVWPLGQDLQVRGPDLQVLRWTTRIEPVQGQRDSHTKVRNLWSGAFRQQSPQPKINGSRKQGKDIADTSTYSTYNQTSQQEPIPYSTEKRMGLTDHTRSGKTTLFRTIINSTKTNIEEPMEVSTKQTARISIPKSRQNRKPELVKVVSAPQQTTNAWTKPFVPSIMEFPLAESAKRAKRSLSGQLAKQHQPIQTKHQQNEEEQMNDVLETIQIALSGATSLLKKISTGNTRLVLALKKIMEAAMDAINTLAFFMILLFVITALFRALFVHIRYVLKTALFRETMFKQEIP